MVRLRCPGLGRLVRVQQLLQRCPCACTEWHCHQARDMVDAQLAALGPRSSCPSPGWSCLQPARTAWDPAAALLRPPSCGRRSAAGPHCRFHQRWHPDQRESAAAGSAWRTGQPQRRACRNLLQPGRSQSPAVQQHGRLLSGLLCTSCLRPLLAEACTGTAWALHLPWLGACAVSTQASGNWQPAQAPPLQVSPEAQSPTKQAAPSEVTSSAQAGSAAQPSMGSPTAQAGDPALTPRQSAAASAITAVLAGPRCLHTARCRPAGPYGAGRQSVLSPAICCELVSRLESPCAQARPREQGLRQGRCQGRCRRWQASRRTRLRRPGDRRWRLPREPLAAWVSPAASRRAPQWSRRRRRQP